METRQLLGIPIKGTARFDYMPIAQKSAEELAPALQPVLDDPFFLAFGWTQYTPYNKENRGISRFVVENFWVKTKADANDTRVYNRYAELVDHINALIEAGVITHNEWDAMNLDDRAKESAENLFHQMDDREDFERYAFGGMKAHPTLGGCDAWTNDYTGQYPKEWITALRFSDTLSGGAFQDVLLNAFGDHAFVTWSRDAGFAIERCNHD